MPQPSSLTRLTYVSQATFKPFHTPEGMECHVAQILTISRKNNRENQLFGALYYGSGNFFQCLEGEKTAVEALYNRLKKDLRHNNLKILQQQPIEQFSFADWDMKYAMIDQQARDFIKQHGLRKFDPSQFSPEMTQQFINILVNNGQDIPEHALQQAVQTAIPEHHSTVERKNLLLAGLLLLIVVLITSYVIL